MVHEDPLCVYFNSDYFTGISESLKIEDLLRFPLITLAEGSGSRGALESAIRESGILSKNHCVDPAIVCSSPLRAIQLADAGEGVAALTPCMIPSSSQNSYVTIAERSIKSFMSVVWNSQKRYLNSCDDFISLVSSEKIAKQFSCTSVKRLKNERFSR
ncbi:LysR substrate-binding domain-containing protein [Kocuria atrinae]|uniref:LysR substrate-binding domain-containing protein n=1 Tax=Kocuria atrinae TaxID=592377 RepID=UPI0037C01203